MDSVTGYLVPMPDGRLMDIRYRFRRGDRVLVIAGPHEGSRATVDSRDGQMKSEHGLVSIPCYNVKLDNGRWAQVQWDWVSGECVPDAGLQISGRL